MQARARFHSACALGTVDEARACWHAARDAIGDVNANEYGILDREPLLCALARGRERPSSAMCAFLVAEAGADPNCTNFRDETPLALVVMDLLERFNSDLHLRPIADALGGAALDHPATARAVVRFAARMFKLPSLACLVATNRGTPFVDALARAPCLHYLVRLRPEADLLPSVRLLLDDLRVDPLERDECGRTVAELPTTSPALRELLADAPLHGSARLAAAGMALHPRLGADSPLHLLDAELLRDFVLPFLLVPTTSVYHTRRARLDALAQAEGLRVSDVFSAREAYLRRGAPFDPPRFRFQHLLQTMPRTLEERLRHAAVAPWRAAFADEEDMREFVRARVPSIEDFRHPFSREVEAAALVALEAALLPLNASGAPPPRASGALRRLRA